MALICLVGGQGGVDVSKAKKLIKNPLSIRRSTQGRPANEEPRKFSFSTTSISLLTQSMRRRFSHARTVSSDLSDAGAAVEDDDEDLGYYYYIISCVCFSNDDIRSLTVLSLLFEAV